MAERIHRDDPFPPTTTPTVAEVLDATRPREAMSVAAAEQRLAEVVAHVAEIGRQLEDKNTKRRRPFATDPHGAWRSVAMKARDELRREERELRDFLERERARLSRGARHRAAIEDLARQDADRATRDARRLAKRSSEQPLWDVYLKAEVALLAIAATGLDIGPLGDSLLRAAQQCVPEWYREHWLHTVYGTTWGHEAARARIERGSSRRDLGADPAEHDALRGALLSLAKMDRHVVVSRYGDVVCRGCGKKLPCDPACPFEVADRLLDTDENNDRGERDER
jgi:hypothetical protein